MKLARIVRSLVFSMPMLVPYPTLACATWFPMEPADIMEADAVFVGNLIAYERVKHEDRESIYTHALLTYRVNEALRSDLPKRVEVLWHNSTFGIPEKAPFPERQIVGLNIEQSEGGEIAYYLQQRPCSGPVQFEGTPRNVEVIKGWLVSGVANPADLQSTVESGNLDDSGVRQIAVDVGSKPSLSRGWDWLTAGLFGFLAIGSLAACIIAWRMVPPQD